ncbi:S8 family serine peptidase [Sphaerisporangium fuscum]|uniref:S8 family serine peptidase n=1 Tax=Sphaerisporangium fuscum TaxID=2835868 RepID=UPI001BDD5640|nr:S8 family serine peptidase [Sphaerisporangium fuscum]
MRLGSALTATIVAGAVGVVAVQGPVPPAEAGRTPEGGARPGVVTLVTGDRVVTSGGGYRVEPGPGRHVRYATRYRKGHLLVFPSDAMPLVAEGVLDERLFDVTQLLAWGYDDAHRGDIPVITQSPGGLAPAPRAARQTRQMAELGMTALRVPKANAGETWKDLVSGTRTLAAGKTRLWLDGRREFTLDQSTKQIGATEAWKQGMTGKGVTVAVLESGYDHDHPDLKGVVTQERNFSDDPDMRDRVGHGTHVASIIAGRGEKYRGVAPEAQLAFGKVGGEFMTDSALLAGMEWAATEVKAKIVNMSLGGTDTLDLDPVEQAINSLSAQTGTLFVVAAGNEGRPGSVSSPGSADAALTVGAVDRQDRMAGFSSAGPRLGDHAIKPEIVAPGVDIVAAAAAGTADGPYVAHSGTSMATPHVAGAAAILAQRHPDWNGERLKEALIGSAKPTADNASPYQQGAGRVDVVRALAQQVVAVPSHTWAYFPWRDSGTRKATGTITYVNSGDAPVTLDLAGGGDTVSLSTGRLEVPAGGEAPVTLTIDAGQKAPGDYPGIVTATAGDTVIRTPVGAYVEPELYEVTITGIARDGRPAFPFGEVYNLETGGWQALPFKNGVAKVRLPKGHWNLYADLFDEQATDTTAHVPLEVDGDREVVLDARKGKQVRFSLDDPTAVPDQRFILSLVNGSWSFGWYALGDPDADYYVLPVKQAGLRYMTSTVWHKKDALLSPYRYDLVDYRTGGIPDDPTYSARTSDLVKVTSSYRASGGSGTGQVVVGARMPGLDVASMLPSPAVPLPGTMTHYRTPGFTWNTEFDSGTATLLGTDRLPDRRPRGEVWNAAVTGPAFTTAAGERTADKLIFPAVQLFTDGVAGRTGFDPAATGTATLTRDGEVVAKTDLAGCVIWSPDACTLAAELPAAPATYTLAVSAHRQSPDAALSTAVDSSWTFRSARTETSRPLPLMAVRYAPEGLDGANRATPGSLTRMPFWIERNPGAPEAAPRSIKLEMSTDDATTWRKVPVVPAGSGWAALLANPRTPGFVSLRATVTDAAGDGVTQTVTRAYAVR